VENAITPKGKRCTVNVSPQYFVNCAHRKTVGHQGSLGISSEVALYVLNSFGYSIEDHVSFKKSDPPKKHLCRRVLG
jgi:hypothetical protein